MPQRDPSSGRCNEPVALDLTHHDCSPRHNRPGRWHSGCTDPDAEVVTTMDDRTNAATWAGDVVLNDGGTVHVRPIKPADAPTLQAFHARQPFESQYFRYFSAKAKLTDAEAERFSTVDLRDRGALIVQDGDDLVAWASYERHANRDDADVAFHVDEAHLKRGIATILLEHLATMAKAAGIQRFTAEVLAENRGMSRVFAHAGWDLERSFDSGVVDLAWSLDDTATLISNIARREHIADSRSMARVFTPRSVALIGASEQPRSVGRTLLENLLADAGGRPLYCVNPAHTELLGQPCVASINDIDAEVDIDLAVIAVPELQLADVLAACARRRVRGAVVITSVSNGFPLAEVVADARRFGMRIVGPGSMGIALPAAQPPLHPHLAVHDIPAGPLAISMQSGSLGASILERTVRLGLGVGAFVSLGTKADVSGNDLLQWWDDDPTIRVVAMYTESFGNPRRFARIARRVGRTKPIIAARVKASEIDDALYRQAGVIRVDTVAQMLHTARVLALQPLPLGRRVAVVSNSDSPMRLLIAGLAVAGLDVINPTADADTNWTTDPEHFADQVRRRLVDGSCDVVVAIVAPPTAPLDENFAAQLAALNGVSTTVPLLTVLLGQDDGALRPGSSIPNFAFPDEAAEVLGRAVKYAEWRTSAADADEFSTTEAQTDDDHAAQRDAVARTVIEHALSLRPTGTLLPLVATMELFDALEIPFARARSVATVDDAELAAAHIGYPVALKSNVRPRLGRGRDGGVALDLADADALRDAWHAIDRALQPNLGGLREATVQVVVPSGIECRIHATTHPALGPVISVGLGGVFADSLGDRVTRLAPVGAVEALSMLSESQVGDVVSELGNAAPAVAAIIARVSKALDDHPELFEVDLNPVLVSANGCWTTDAIVRVRPTAPELPTRRLA
jgi:acyl-CoA synthetase (NDP forming)/GNAT superfamily N-acetyltransferase